MEVFRFFSGENLFRDEAYLQDTLLSTPESTGRKSSKRVLHELFMEHMTKKAPSDNSKNSWQRAYNACHKDWFHLKVLLGYHDWLNVIGIAEQNLKRATKFELTEMVVDMYRVLMLYYGSVAGLSKKYYACLEAVQHWEIISQAEINAERRYSELILFSDLHKGDNQKIHEEAVRIFERVNQDMQKYRTYALHLYGRLIQNLTFTTSGDYLQSVAVCEDAIRFFKDKGYSAKNPVGIFLCRQMFSFLQTRNFQAGKRAAEEGEKYLEKGSPNWFIFQGLLVLLALHTKEYEQAYAYYLAAISHRQLDVQHSVTRETWSVIEAYLFFLAEQGKIQLSIEDKRLSRFRPHKFLNDIPVLSKDKRGMNIPILIFQIIVLVSKNRHDEAIARIEAVEKYRTRYLRSENSYRSNYFIKMLMTIPAQGFRKKAVIRHTMKYLAKLSSASFDFANSSSDFEIIPYEDLWEIVLDTLQDSKRYQAKHIQ
jgi:hypothetical protein